jgi:effector-binding domain-containing protein
MLKKLLLSLAALVTVFVLGGLFLPEHQHVERSIVIERPQATVFTILNGYRAFAAWSPWAGRDPQAEFVLSGPQTGEGASLSWSGDPRLVGTGSQRITRSLPFELIEVFLDFGTQGVAESRFMLAGEGAHTRLTWSLDADVTRGQGFIGALLGRYFGLFYDRWIGSDFEQGLANLKRHAESLPAADFAGARIELLEVEPVEILYVSGSTSQDSASVTAALAEAYAEISAFMAANGLEATGQPMAITRGWDEFGYRFEAAIPAGTAGGEPPGRIRFGLSPGGPAVRMVHRGSYAGLLDAYARLAAFMAASGLREGAVSWEHYVSDPAVTAPEELVTHIYMQLGE